jgi:hypothetical protein
MTNVSITQFREQGYLSLDRVLDPEATTVRDILGHLGEPTTPPRIAPARGPPLWEAVDPEHDPAEPPR